MKSKIFFKNVLLNAILAFTDLNSSNFRQIVITNSKKIPIPNLIDGADTAQRSISNIT